MKRSRRHKINLSEKNLPRDQYLQHIKQLSKAHIDKALKSMGVCIKPKK